MFLTIYAPQERTTRAEFRSVSVLAAVDSLYYGGAPAKSLALAESFLVDMNDVELRWRAARAAIAAGTLAEADGERRLWFDRALLHARNAVALRPDARARYWLAAAAGRRANRDDPMLSARLAVEVYELTTSILAEDSSHAGAHHALGMLHAEVTRLPSLARFLATRVLRMDLASRASAREAERHLRRAVALDPQSTQYLADLAIFLIRARRSAEADGVVEQLLRTPPRHPVDVRVREAAIRLRREYRHPVAPRPRHQPEVAAAAS